MVINFTFISKQKIEIEVLVFILTFHWKILLFLLMELHSCILCLLNCITNYFTKAIFLCEKYFSLKYNHKLINEKFYQECRLINKKKKKLFLKNLENQIIQLRAYWVPNMIFNKLSLSLYWNYFSYAYTRVYSRYLFLAIEILEIQSKYLFKINTTCGMFSSCYWHEYWNECKKIRRIFIYILYWFKTTYTRFSK